MSVRNYILSHIRAIRFPGIWIYIPIIVVLVVLAILAVIRENDYSFYWRDPAAIMGTGPWIGLFSNIGIFIWWIAGVVTVFSGLLLWGVTGRRTTSAFLLSWGILTGVLALDDFFMIHEWVVPTYLPLSPDVLFGVYFFVAFFLLFIFRNEILASPYPIFVFAGGCFALSIMIDLIGPFRSVEWGMPARLVWTLEYIVEDGLKMIGIIAWAHYFILVSFGVVRPYLAGTDDTDTERLPAERRKRSKVR